MAFSWKLQSRSLGARWARHSILFYSYTCCMQENCHHGQAKWPSLPWVSYGSLVECLKYSSEGRRFLSFRRHSMFSPSMPVSFTKSFTNLLHTRRIEMSTCGAHVQWWCEWRWLILILVNMLFSEWHTHTRRWKKKKESNLRPPDWYFRHSTSESI